MLENIMEELYAEFLLWKHGFCSSEKYDELLHKIFLLDYYNDYLLELEENTSNIRNSSGCFLRYWTYENTDLDIHKFGKLLFSGLKDVYYSNTLSIEQFGKCCYSLWGDLPDDPLKLSKPFLILSYADDLFLYSYEEQTRRCYERAFKFYDDEANGSPQ